MFFTYRNKGVLNNSIAKQHQDVIGKCASIINSAILKGVAVLPGRSLVNGQFLPCEHKN